MGRCLPPTALLQEARRLPSDIGLKLGQSIEHSGCDALDQLGPPRDCVILAGLHPYVLSQRCGEHFDQCFSRQISMYLAKHVGGWSMVKIGRFYNGRHHTTVLHAIQKVQRLRCEDESVDALIEVLTAALREDVGMKAGQDNAVTWRAELVETVAARVLDRLAELQADVGWSRGAS